MKKIFKYLAFILIINIPSTVLGDSQCTPASSWEQLREGIAVALGLTDHRVTVSLKNTSNTLKEIVNQPDGKIIQVFYLDDQGVRVSLGHFKNPGDPRSTVVEKTSGSIEIPPGGEVLITRAVHISQQELALVKAHPVICSLIVYDPETKKKYTAESSPRILVQEYSTASHK